MITYGRRKFQKFGGGGTLVINFLFQTLFSFLYLYKKWRGRSCATCPIPPFLSSAGPVCVYLKFRYKKFRISRWLQAAAVRCFSTVSTWVLTFYHKYIQCTLGDTGFFRLQGIEVLWRLHVLENLRTLHLKFQKAQTKIKVFLALPCWLSKFS